MFLRTAIILLSFTTVLAETTDDAKKWQVSKPPWPLKDVMIDTSEGTWMSLDVSPDGRTIVFDMLGDIFAIPIEGGEATVLTQGLAWDMQPSFSPDGSLIAFTSDRGGADNIWVMAADGSDPRAITTEDFRLLNSPAWTPDGKYIAARKHFTGSRSLGSGEIWLYHVQGGSGVQLTEKPNEQKDVGEPAFSPDGRYLYYSQDVTPGNTFEYNKDPHRGIYAIQRLDRQSGESTRLIAGSGGAIRPTPSPDGKFLAFVKRLDYETAIFLYNRESGEVYPVFNKLDRDLQETWAIHGVYPRIDWTPDSQSIVFWAAGKVNRLHVDSMTYTPIPFHVKTTHEMSDAVRFPVEVAPDQFNVKMLRWVDVSGDGSRALFQALGHIYIKDLPTGVPHRLTSQTDHFEFYPRFSADGRYVYYTTWHDQELGSIRRVSVRGGKTGKVISNGPGHYAELAVSPDSKTLVYRKTTGGWLRSSLFSLEPGLYVLDLKSGTSRKLTDGGYDPHFGAASDTLFYSETGDNTRLLKRITVDGRDMTQIASSKKAAEFRVSPDGKWLAFNEAYNAFVIPFPAPGKSIDLAPDLKSLPIRQVSTDAGYNLTWSTDSGHLYWSLGPQLHSVAVNDQIFEKDTELTTANFNLSFEHPYAKPETSYALIGARIVTMNGDRVIENGTIIVKGNRIAEVGPYDSIPVSSEMTRYDISGSTVIPGIVDVHAHGSQATDGITPQQNWRNYATLCFGVTTLHDPSNDTEEIFAASELAKAGSIVAPRLFSTGTILYGADLPEHTASINSQEDAAHHLARLKEVGAFSVKSYNQPRRNQRQQVLAAALDLKMMVVPEGGSLFQHNMTMVADGHTGIEHSIPIARAYDDVIQFWGATDVHYTPTLGVGYGGVWGENYWYQKTDVWAHERLSKFVPDFALDPRSKRREMVPDEEFNHIQNARICKQLSDAGVRVNIGAHGQREGLAAHWEIWMLVQGGMTPHEALTAATINGAAYLGLDKDLGSIEKGKLADLVVLGKNPLENIRHTDTVQTVAINGVLYDAETMHEIHEGGRVRERFFWRRHNVTHISFPALQKTGQQQGCVCGH